MYMASFQVLMQVKPPNQEPNLIPIPVIRHFRIFNFFLVSSIDLFSTATMAHCSGCTWCHGLFFSIVTLLTGMLSICGCELLHCIMNYIIEYLLEIAFGKYYMSITVLVCSYYTLGNFLTIKVFCQCSELCLLPLPPPPLSQVHRCCWTVVITFLFTSVIGIPFPVLIIHNFKNKGLT